MYMKKKKYETPLAEIEWLTIKDIIRTSGQDPYDDEDDEDGDGNGGTNGTNSLSPEF